ncbi:hypothetical protein [Cytophaga aurantiaca]|uniref:hypothetical protein n=1 Tax=Cytophaga aurantiaca TaxID=29530 RepID=UPI00039F34BE|nr:hypothetical protein [Cytophaga aurantiaca]
MKRIFLVLFICVFFSCKKEDVKVNEESPLIGQWDSYYYIWGNQSTGTSSPAYNVLFNYEQGFEIFTDKTYVSRYISAHTDLNPGTWQSVGDSITFTHINIDGNKEALTFAITKVDKSELIMKRKDGLSIYLKKN